MSLDITLTREKWVSYDKGETYTVEMETCFDTNITHNLNTMADAAGIYKALWRPEEINITKAGELIEIIESGLNLLKSDPERFRQFNAPSGWGMYEHFVPFVEKYLDACKKYPDAIIEVDR